MNEIAKKSISEKLMKALHDESITNMGGGRLLGVKTEYISMIKNPRLWNKCPISSWEAVLKWVNSGQRLQKYGEKHGNVANEIPVVKKEKVKTKPAEFEEDTSVCQAQIGWILAMNKEGKSAEQISRKLKIYLPIVQQVITGAVVPLHESHSVLEKEEVIPEEHKKLSIGEMVDLLLAEKALLKQKLDAIDTLLKFYIS